MLSAIGPTTLPNSAGIAPTGGLSVQLDQYQKQLADLETCQSGKTTSGKTKIADLTGKISEIKRRMESADTANGKHRPFVAEQNTSADKGKGPVVSNASGHVGARQLSISHQSAGGPVGGNVDVYA